MKIRYLMLACAAAISMGNAAAGVYKWVDEHGVTQYGDVVPEKYAEKSKQANIKSTGPTAEDQNAAQRLRDRERNEARRLDYEQNKPKGVLIQNDNARAGTSADCQQQWNAYNDSTACFSRYRQPNGTMRAGAASVCRDVRTPTCQR
jgi:hypothetical protein